jgi:hypothetical protein
MEVESATDEEQGCHFVYRPTVARHARRHGRGCGSRSASERRFFGARQADSANRRQRVRQDAPAAAEHLRRWSSKGESATCPPSNSESSAAPVGRRCPQPGTPICGSPYMTPPRAPSSALGVGGRSSPYSTSSRRPTNRSFVSSRRCTAERRSADVQEFVRSRSNVQLDPLAPVALSASISERI